MTVTACEARMANDMRRRSGRVCDLDKGHAGPHASQMSAAGLAARMRRYHARLDAPQSTDAGAQEGAVD